MMLVIAVMMVMMPAADVNMIGTAAEPAQEEEETQRHDQKAHQELDAFLYFFTVRGGQEQEDERQCEDDGGVREGRHEAQDESMKCRSILPDEIRRDERLAVAGREGVRGTED